MGLLFHAHATFHALNNDAGLPEILAMCPKFICALVVYRADAPERGKLLIAVIGKADFPTVYQLPIMSPILPA